MFIRSRRAVTGVGAELIYEDHAGKGECEVSHWPVDNHLGDGIVLHWMRSLDRSQEGR